MEEIESKTVNQLKQYCREKHINGFSNIKKKELIQLIIQNKEENKKEDVIVEDENKNDVKDNKIDQELLNFIKSDVFTPDIIVNMMNNYLTNDGNLLDPAVGKGNLINKLNLNNYSNIDIYDIKKDYLDHCPNNKIVNKYNLDFIKAPITKKYKNIIMNPPYIRIQDLSNDYINFIRNNFKILNNGNIDLYYTFIIKCINLLEDDGIMIAITPNSYLYNKSALNLRKYLIENKFIHKIIDFNFDKVFKNVSTYCCITIFTKKNKEELIYNDQNIKYSIINNKEWNIFQTNVKSKKLKDICKIKNGIATLRDKIYIHDVKLYNEPCWKIITNSRNDKWIIFPYDDNGKIIKEHEFKELNPLTYNYLIQNKEELLKRDKGKKEYVKWYAFGRTQSLVKSNYKEVIYIPTFINPNNFKIKIEKPKLHHSCLSIEPLNDNINLIDIKNIIESNIDFLIRNCSKRGGGWISLSSRVLYGISYD